MSHSYSVTSKLLITVIFIICNTLHWIIMYSFLFVTVVVVNLLIVFMFSLWLTATRSCVKQGGSYWCLLVRRGYVTIRSDFMFNDFTLNKSCVQKAWWHPVSHLHLLNAYPISVMTYSTVIENVVDSIGGKKADACEKQWFWRLLQINYKDKVTDQWVRVKTAIDI